ncbi:MAG TPA: hypothetical protein V6C64_08005, partial [Microcoleaceae cyanobacterium]
MYQPVDLQSLFVQFQNRYPASSLITELVQIHEHHFIVRALMQSGGVTLATSMATGATVELAEDQARSRLFSLLGIVPTTGNTHPDIIPTAGIPGNGTSAQFAAPNQLWTTSPNHLTTSDSSMTMGSTPPASSSSTSLDPATTAPVLAASPSRSSTVTAPERSPSPELSPPIETPIFSPPPRLEVEVPPAEPEPITSVDPLLPTYHGLDLELSPEPSPFSYNGLEDDDTVAIDDEFPLEERLPAIEPLPPLESVVPNSRTTKSSRPKTSKASAESLKTSAPTDAPIDLAPLFLQIEQEMERIHWTKEQGRDHLKRTYGK